MEAGPRKRDRVWDVHFLFDTKRAYFLSSAEFGRCERKFIYVYRRASISRLSFLGGIAWRQVFCNTTLHLTTPSKLITRSENNKSCSLTTRIQIQKKKKIQSYNIEQCAISFIYFYSANYKRCSTSYWPKCISDTGRKKCIRTVKINCLISGTYILFSNNFLRMISLLPVSNR